MPSARAPTPMARNSLLYLGAICAAAEKERMLAPIAATRWVFMCFILPDKITQNRPSGQKFHALTEGGRVYCFDFGFRTADFGFANDLIRTTNRYETYELRICVLAAPFGLCVKFFKMHFGIVLCCPGIHACCGACR